MNWEKDDTFLSKWLNGELSEAEKQAFEATEEGQEFLAMLNASTLLEPTPYDTEAEFSKLNVRIQSGPQQKQVFWRHSGFQLSIAASVALVIAFVYLFTLGDPTITTGYSEQEIVMLPDGSEVKLNASSQLSYDEKNWADQRSLELQGEAFFDVRKGSKFSVKTPNGNVEVLGTSFNVKARGAGLQVACYTGKVAVEAASVRKQLTPGEQILVKNGEMIAFRKAELDEQPAWTRGITELENVALAEVLDELTFIFGVTVEYDGSLNELTYTGAFPNQNAEAAFKLVFNPLNVQYSYDLTSKKLVILGLNQ